jgi:hypothetical protein
MMTSCALSEQKLSTTSISAGAVTKALTYPQLVNETEATAVAPRGQAYTVL